MSEWQKVTLDSLVSLQRGFDLPKSRRCDGSVPVVGAAGVSGWHDVAQVKGPGVVVGRAGSMGHATYVKEDFWPLNTSLFVTDFQGNDPRFVYYKLSLLDFSGYNSGAVQPMLNRNYIKKIPITLPEPAEQRAISAALGALDDKIAVDERIAITARQLGLALFKAATDAASELKSVGEISTYLNRGQSPRYTDDDHSILVVNQKCVRDGRVLLAPARRTEAARLQSDRILQQGDILVNSTGMGTLGRVGIWNHHTTATVDSHITIARADSRIVPPIIAGYSLITAQPEIELMGEGSTGQTELSRSKLGSVRLRLPIKHRQELKAKLLAIEARANAALDDIDTLARLRDALLPRLISGEIRVKQAEKVVEDAT